MVTAAHLVAKVSVDGSDKAKSDLEGIGGTVGKVGGFLGTALVGAAAAGGSALLGIGVASTKMAANFQEGLTSLVTGAGESQKDLKMVSDGILNIATQTGTSTKQLTDGMYMIESAGFHAANGGLDVLRAAAEGAKVGNADLGVVAGAVTTVMHDYASSHISATQATNALITTVASGKTHMEDLSNSLAAILPLASSLHIPFEQVAGAVATMTNAGMPAQQATQNLAFAVRALNVETPKGADALKQFGLSAEGVHNTLITKGLPATLEMIEDHIGKKFPLSSKDGQEALKDIMGGAVGLNVALMVGGDHMKEYTSDVDAIGSKLRASSKDVQGWSDVQQDFNFKISQAQEVLETLGIKIGTALLPIAGQLIGKFTDLASNLQSYVTPIMQDFMIAIHSPEVAELINKLKELGNTLVNIIAPGFSTSSIDVFFDFIITTAIPALSSLVSALTGTIQFIYNARTAIEIVGGILLMLFIPAIIKSGVESVIASVKIGVNYVGSIIKVGIEGWQAAAKLVTSLIPAFIKSGAEAVANAAKITASFVGSMIKAGAEAVASGAKIAASFIASMVKAGIEAAVNAAKITASFIASMIATGAQAVITGAEIVASFIAGLVAAGAEAIVSAGIMLATLVPALATVAIEVIAATWPFLLIAAVVAAVVIGIILAIQHWGQICAWLQGVWAAFSSWFSGLMHNIVAWVGNTVSNIVSWFQQLPGRVMGAISSLGSSIGGFFSNLASQALAWGADMIGNFISGITGAAGALIAKAQDIASSVASILHFSKPDTGPLRDAVQWMPDMMQLLADGMTQNLGKVKSAALNVSATIANPNQSSFASSSAGGLGGLSVVPSSVSQGATPINITVQSAPVYLDGKALASGLLSPMVGAIRSGTGTFNY